MGDPALNSTSAHGLLDKFPPGTLPASVTKELIYAGTAEADQPSPPYPAGSRLRFHFKTTKTEGGKVYDDSRKHPKPMELIIGKKFKVEIWELAVNTMRVKEVAKFVAPTSMCVLYPMVSKVLRDSYKGDSHRSKSCCGSMLNGTGHPDLDELLKSPQGLTFTFEMLEVKLPGEYEMEAWYMTDDQKIASLTALQEAGNKLFGEKRYKDASDKYFEAISRIEQLLTKEVPGSQEMRDLKLKKVPLLLNYAFCKQKEQDYYESILHINSVLELDPNNLKGLFRRGQCHKLTGSFDLARQDYTRVLQIDGSLHSAVRLELEEMIQIQHQAMLSEKLKYQRMFTPAPNPNPS